MIFFFNFCMLSSSGGNVINYTVIYSDGVLNVELIDNAYIQTIIISLYWDTTGWPNNSTKQTSTTQGKKQKTSIDRKVKRKHWNISQVQRQQLQEPAMFILMEMINSILVQCKQENKFKTGIYPF